MSSTRDPKRASAEAGGLPTTPERSPAQPAAGEHALATTADHPPERLAAGSGAVAAHLRNAAELPPLQEGTPQATRAKLLARAEREKSRRGFSWASFEGRPLLRYASLAAAAVLVVTAALMLGTGPSSRTLPTTERTANAQPELLLAGRSEHRATRERPLRLRTQHLGLVESFSARFEVASERVASTVFVSEGEVRVVSLDGRREVVLHAGESISSGDVRLASVAHERSSETGRSSSETSAMPSGREAAAEAKRVPLPRERVSELRRSSASAAPVPSCSGASQRVCLERLSEGSALAAQNALFALALQERDARRYDRAVALSQRYLGRFATGVFAPDVRLLEIEALAEQGHSQKLLRAIAAYLDLHATETAASAVWLLRGDLLAGDGQLLAARQAYASAVHSDSSPVLQAESLYGQGLTFLLAGDESAALKLFRRALEVAPSGPRATELRERIQP